MNPEPNLPHEQPPVLTDLPAAAMPSPSPSSTSSSSSTSSRSSKGSSLKKEVVKDEDEDEGMPRKNKDDLSTPPLIGKVGPTSTIPPAVAAAVSSYVLPKAKKARRSAKRKGDDASKPRRPLSAYNYFFKENRAMLLAERDETLKKAKESGEGTEGIESGYGFFGTMAKVIAQRWKEITQDSLDVYKKRAEIDSKRYREEMEEYNARKRLAPKALDVKKGKKAKIKALKKEKGSKGGIDLSAAAKYGIVSGATADDARALAGVYAAPQDYVLQAQQMGRFAPPQPQQSMSSGLDYSSMGLGGVGGGGGMGVIPRSAMMSMAATNQLMGMGQADLEAQLALLQQQRQLEAMGLFTQATRPALLGIPSHQLGYQVLGGAGGGAAAQQQYVLDQVGGVQSLLGSAPAATMNDLSYSSRMDAYAQQQQQQQQQQLQQEQEVAFLRQQQQQQQLLQQDPGYANLILQMRLQEQEDRLRSQAALGLGQGRW